MGWSSRLSLVLGGLGVALAGVEVVCRITGYGSPVSGVDVVMSWEPASPFEVRLGSAISLVMKPDWTGRQVYRSTVTGDEIRAVDVRTSSWGLRGPEPDDPKTRTRVLGLGDSVTFGQGVAEEDTFLSVFQRTAAKPVEVVNAGVPSWDTAPEVAWLEQTGMRLDPDLVLLLFFVNDVARATRIEGADQERPVPHAAPPWATREAGFRRFSFLVNAVCRVFERERLARERVPQPSWRGGTYLDELRRELDPVLVRGHLARLKSVCDARKTPCTVVFLPVMVDGANDPGTDLLDRVAEIATGTGLPVVRVDDALRDIPVFERQVLPADRHPSPAAHAAIGRALAARLALPEN